MKYLSSDEIREEFLRYFEDRGHKRILGSSLLPQNDPTLLFVNSGMAPLKPFFTGARVPESPNLCNIQPCIRTRDIDDVGDRHHLTFFEMLGSWSIGDYFKERAVELAYGLIVDKFKFPSEKLYVTVYSGDPTLGLEPDDDTARAWERVGVPRDHIVYLGEDNFWGPAGETGPCGPCTEMFFDTGEEFGPTYRPGGEFDSKHRYIEVWNAGVFMQLDKRADGSFARLPFYSVDTGSGLERMAMVLQGVNSVYETDLFEALTAGVQARLGSAATQTASRIIADHTRSACLILSEGVMPGNEGRSYIPRRLIRKCLALVAQAGLEKFDYSGLIDIVLERFQGAYPLLRERREEVTAGFLREADEFQRIIAKGIDRLDQLLHAGGEVRIGGKEAFDLFATYGLPLEITRDFVAERGGTLDEDGFAREFKRHQHVSRAIGKATDDAWAETSAALESSMAGKTSDFVGYEAMDTDATIVAMAADGQAIARADEGSWVDIVTSATPFYAEGGGQVGDHGTISGAAGGEARVIDTRRLGTIHVHRAEIVRGSLSEGEQVHLTVHEDRRRSTMANHSATHLLHAALREILGPHVRQAGSLVEPDRLRFDFHHESKLTAEELEAVEARVNQLIRENHAREITETSYREAVDAGALAFFGDSYGDKVRVLRFGTASTELCGGTHVGATGEIGAFRILSEGSVARGVRRIVALTGEAAVRHTLAQEQQLRQLAAQLKVPVTGLSEKVAQLLSRGQPAKAPAESGHIRIDIADAASTLAGGVPFLATRVDETTEILSTEATRVAAEIGGVVVLAGEANGKASLVVAVANPLTDRFNASQLLRALAPYVDGRGGGSAGLARGGGNNPGGIVELLDHARKHAEAVARETV
jgi:alanyl-tRNA synthetase